MNNSIIGLYFDVEDLLYHNRMNKKTFQYYAYRPLANHKYHCGVGIFWSFVMSGGGELDIGPISRL